MDMQWRQWRRAGIVFLADQRQWRLWRGEWCRNADGAIRRFVFAR
jgi:hypothetical protein